MQTTKKRAAPKDGPLVNLVHGNVRMRLRSRGTKRDLHAYAGARVWIRRAPKPVRRLAALHLQSPFKHVTQN